MSTSHRRVPEHDTQWPLAAAVGAAAGLIRPVVVEVSTAVGVDPGVLGMTMQPDLPVWWLVHLAYSFAFGGLYAGVTYRGRLRRHVSAPVTGAVVGAAYGLALWVVNVAVAWEFVVTTVLPLLDIGGSLVGPLVGHVVYGAVLGAVYPLVRRDS